MNWKGCKQLPILAGAGWRLKILEVGTGSEFEQSCTCVLKFSGDSWIFSFIPVTWFRISYEGCFFCNVLSLLVILKMRSHGTWLRNQVGFLMEMHEKRDALSAFLHLIWLPHSLNVTFSCTVQAVLCWLLILKKEANEKIFFSFFWNRRGEQFALKQRRNCIAGKKLYVLCWFGDLFVSVTLWYDIVWMWQVCWNQW